MEVQPPYYKVAFALKLIAIVSDEIKAEHEIRYEAIDPEVVIPELDGYPLMKQITISLEID